MATNILCQAGKGRSPMMSHNKAYAAGYEGINWHRKKKKLSRQQFKSAYFAALYGAGPEVVDRILTQP